MKRRSIDCYRVVHAGRSQCRCSAVMKPIKTVGIEGLLDNRVLYIGGIMSYARRLPG